MGLARDMKDMREEEERKWIDSLKNADNKVQHLSVTFFLLKRSQEENKYLKRDLKTYEDKT